MNTEHLKKLKDKFKVGDQVLFEQCWEDEGGNYHDEWAEILRINKFGNLKLAARPVYEIETAGIGSEVGRLVGELVDLDAIDCAHFLRE